MEFKFDINNLFGDVISRLDSSLQPHRTTPDRWQWNEYRRQMQQVLDLMGDASAKAQGLPATITTAAKMSYSNHRLYVMKDGNANQGLGAMVGILKVGRKKLFIYDANGRCHEIEPLCLLDFYVHESRQRMGCGHQLFTYMLQCEGVQPHQLAIDKPSFKLLSFLAKHYGLRATLPQVNNFVIFEAFFSHRHNPNTSRSRKDLLPTHGRQSKNGLHPLAQNSHRGDAPLSVRPPRPPSGHRGPADNRPPSGSRPQSGQWPHSGRRSRSNSRPGSAQRPSSRASSPHVQPSRPPDNVVSLDMPVLRDLKLVPRDAGTKSETALRRPDLMADSNQSCDTEDKSASLRLDLQGRPRFNMAAGATMYSRHGNPVTTNGQANMAPSGTTRPTTPPLLRRDAVSRPLPEQFNLHQDYQDRYGHLRTENAPTGPPGMGYAAKSASSPSGRPPLPPALPPPQAGQGGKDGGLPPLANNTAWTVFGVVPNHRNLASKHRAHSRLW